MNAAAISNTPTDVTVSCAKCDGRGVILAFSGIANGRCFTCGGSGRVKCLGVRMLAAVCSSLRQTANTVMLAVHDGDIARAEFYAAAMIPDMFRIGTEKARDVLSWVRSGGAFDDDVGHVQLSDAHAREAVDLLVRLGREAVNRG